MVVDVKATAISRECEPDMSLSRLTKKQYADSLDTIERTKREFPTYYTQMIKHRLSPALRREVAEVEKLGYENYPWRTVGCATYRINGVIVPNGDI